MYIPGVHTIHVTPFQLHIGGGGVFSSSITIINIILKEIKEGVL